MAGTALNFDPIFAASPLPPIISQQQNQRKTIEHSSSLLTQEIRTTFNKLDQLWDQVNMEPEIREHRVQQACQFVNNLLNDIVTSEEQMVRSVATDSDARRKVIADLRKFFKKPSFDESAYKQGSIALLKALDAEMTRLANMRDEAVGKQTELCEKYQMFCRRLDTLPRQIDIEEQLLSDTEFLELTEKVHELKSIFNKRLERALQLQSEAKKIFDIIHLPTNNSIREEDLQCLRMDLHQQHVVLSQELLDKFSALNEKLKDLHDSWIEEVAFRYDELLIKLDEISAKCFRPPTAKGRENVKYERLNEKELSKLEEEIRKREELYARAQPVFDKLNEWMASWKQKLETEQRVCRASFYKNRAGILNQKLKQKRMVEQQVPRLFNELQTLCEEYVKYNSVCDIHVDGMRADKYADWVMKGYQQDRDMQRVQKQISSSKLAQTPGRTHNVFSTMRTPTRAVRKLNPVPATVAVGYNPRKRSFSCSQLSDIFPVKTRAYGPTTSTPKPEWS